MNLAGEFSKGFLLVERHRGRSRSQKLADTQQSLSYVGVGYDIRVSRESHRDVAQEKLCVSMRSCARRRRCNENGRVQLSRVLNRPIDALQSQPSNVAGQSSRLVLPTQGGNLRLAYLSRSVRPNVGMELSPGPIPSQGPAPDGRSCFAYARQFYSSQVPAALIDHSAHVPPSTPRSIGRLSAHLSLRFRDPERTTEAFADVQKAIARNGNVYG